MAERPWSDDEDGFGRRLYATGATLNEIAAKLGRSYGAVKSRCLRSKSGATPWARAEVRWCAPDESAERNREVPYERGTDRQHSARECMQDVPNGRYIAPPGPRGRMHDAGERDGKYPCPSVPVEESVLSQAPPAVPGQDTFRAQEADPAHDPALHVPTAPRGYHLRGVSTLLDGAGVPVQTWVKTTRDPAQSRLDALFEAIKSLPEDFRAAHKLAPQPDDCEAYLACVYPVADAHFGMFSWREETGQDYDLHEAERLHSTAIKSLVDGAPPARQAVVVSLGDFFHCDSDLARTERSGNPLDTDTRWAKVLRVGVRSFRALIDACLTKHEKVHVVCEIGNHDDRTSVMLALAIDAFYERDDRVTVDTSPGRFHYWRWGKCLLGITHGDGPAMSELPGIMAADRPRDWGETRYRYWYTGHKHKESKHDGPGCLVEGFRTLAPRDAWAHGRGYRADRDMRVDVLHREWGRITSNTVGIERVA